MRQDEQLDASMMAVFARLAKVYPKLTRKTTVTYYGYRAAARPVFGIDYEEVPSCFAESKE